MYGLSVCVFQCPFSMFFYVVFEGHLCSLLTIGQGRLFSYVCDNMPAHKNFQKPLTPR